MSLLYPVSVPTLILWGQKIAEEVAFLLKLQAPLSEDTPLFFWGSEL